MSTTARESALRAIEDIQTDLSRNLSRTVKTPLIIRDMRLSDTLQLIEMLQQWAEETGNIPPTTSNMSNGKWICCVSSNGILLGFTSFVPVKIGGITYQRGVHLYVHPMHRRRNVGFKLYRAALNYVKSTKMPLLVNTEWERKELWMKAGYKPKFVTLVREL